MMAMPCTCIFTVWSRPWSHKCSWTCPILLRVWSRWQNVLIRRLPTITNHQHNNLGGLTSKIVILVGRDGVTRWTTGVTNLHPSSGTTVVPEGNNHRVVTLGVYPGSKYPNIITWVTKGQPPWPWEQHKTLSAIIAAKMAILNEIALSYRVVGTMVVPVHMAGQAGSHVLGPTWLLTSWPTKVCRSLMTCIVFYNWELPRLKTNNVRWSRVHLTLLVLMTQHNIMMGKLSTQKTEFGQLLTLEW